MRIKEYKPPREFITSAVRIRHCGDIELSNDEQVTFVTKSGCEYDVVRKSWGYYATPSINGRLKTFGLRGALTCNKDGKIFLLLVEKGAEEEFSIYVDKEKINIICWLDSDLPIVKSILNDNKEE